MKCILLFQCLYLMFWFLLPRVFSKCQRSDYLSIFVYPERTIRVLYGNPLEIFCEDDRYTADDLEFSVPSQKVNTTTRRLFMEHHKKGSFTYYCKNKITKKVCITRVVVDSAPMDVTDFACISRNLDSLTCTWTNPTSYSAMNYSLNYIFNRKQYTACSAISTSTNTNCSWNTSGVPRYNQVLQQFSFNLKFCNYFGCNEQMYNIDHYTIVKPDPPSNLKVLSNGTRSVLLQWTIPNNMVDLLPNGVDHRIEYQIAKIDNTSYFRAVNTSGLPARNKIYKFLLSDLPYAHMQYEVRISIKTKEAVKDEFWSDFTYLVFYTASERPRRPPDTAVGFFDQNLYETTRRINIYWKQLEEYEEAGANFTYKVVVYQDTDNPKTLLADNKKSLSYVVLEDASLGAINVDIWSANNNGSSHTNSNLYIPPYMDTVALRVQSLTKISYANGTHQLAWVEIKKIDNYTLFWCEYKISKTCAGRMNFTILELNKTNHVIDLPRENRYQFAISANSGTKTSGMIWDTCAISADGIPMYGFPVKLEHGVPGKSFVKINWTMACTLQEGIINGYIITYCPVIDGKECDMSFGNSTINILDPKQMEVNITGLKPYRTYRFRLALNTTYGNKTIDNASTECTTTEDTPTTPINVRITEVESNSAVITWDPPLDKNGIMRKYIIYNYSEEYDSAKVDDGDKDSIRRSFKLRGLNGFSNYSWSVVACNSAVKSCSQKSPPNGIFLRTRTGPPSKLRSINIFTNSSDFIKWEKPEGPVNFYQILRIKNGQHENILNTSNTAYPLGKCEEDTSEEKYKVRAVNNKVYIEYNDVLTNVIKRHEPKEKLYQGEWSDPITVDCKSNSAHTITFIAMTVFAIAACSIVIVYEIIKFCKKRRTTGLL